MRNAVFVSHLLCRCSLKTTFSTPFISSMSLGVWMAQFLRFDQCSLIFFSWVQSPTALLMKWSIPARGVCGLWWCCSVVPYHQNLSRRADCVCTLNSFILDSEMQKETLNINLSLFKRSLVWYWQSTCAAVWAAERVMIKPQPDLCSSG